MRLLIEKLAGLSEVCFQLFDPQAEGGVKSWAGIGSFDGLGGVFQFYGAAFEARGTAPTDFIEKFGDGVSFFCAKVGDEFRAAELAALQKLRDGACGGGTVAGAVEGLDPPVHFETRNLGGFGPGSFIGLNEVVGCDERLIGESF